MYVCTLFKVDQVLAVQSANKNQLRLQCFCSEEYQYTYTNYGNY